MKERINPRYAKEPVAPVIEGTDEDFEPIKGDLFAMLQTGGWDRVEANLRRRSEHLRERMADDSRMPEAEWRLLQKEHAIYQRILTKPLEFFTETP